MKLVHTWDSHDYPFFDKQRDIIREKSESGLNEFKDTLEDVITFYIARKEKSVKGAG